MADDKLTLVASVEDRFTAPLTKLKTALGQVGSTPAAKSLAKDFEGANAAIDRTRTAIQSVTPALAALGVGGFGAVTAISGITSAIRAFSGNTQQLALMSRETGLTIDKLRAFGELGERFGVSAQTMQGALQNLATGAHDIRRNWGEAYTTLQAMNLGELAAKLAKSANMDQYLSTALEGLGKIDNPITRQKVSILLFGTPDVGKVAGALGADLEKVLRELQARMGTTTQEQVAAAERFEKSLSDLRASAEGLKTQALTPLIDEFARLLKMLSSADATAFFKGELEGIKKGAKDVRDEFEQIGKLWDKFKEVFKGSDKEQEMRKLLNPSSFGGVGVQQGPLFQHAGWGGGPGAVGLIQRAGYGGFVPPTYGGGGGYSPPLAGGGGSRVYGGGAGGGAGPVYRDGPAISPHAPTPVLGGAGFGGSGGLRRGGSGAGSGGSIPAIPDSVPMTAQERNTLGLIMNYESRGRNVMNYVGRSQGLDPQTPKGYTAQGYFQMLNSNWRRIAPGLGIKAPNAMAGSLEDQTSVALHLLRHGGVGNWANYNPALRAALARGEKAPPGSLPPISTAGPGQADSDPKPWHQRDTYTKSRDGGYSRLRDDEVKGPGEEMLYRRLGAGANTLLNGPHVPKLTGSASLDITFNNAPAGMKTKTSTEGMFRRVQVSKSRQMASAEDHGEWI